MPSLLKAQHCDSQRI